MFARQGLVSALVVGACGTDTDGLAGGVLVGEVTIYQGPAIPLIADGELVTTRQAPVLAGRRGRMHVALASHGDEPRDVTVRVELTRAPDEPRLLEQTVTLTGVRTDIDLDFASDLLQAGDDVAFSVLEAPGFSSKHDVIGARFPEVGRIPLDVRRTPRFRVLVVPTGPIPPTIPVERADAWRDALEAMLPVTDVELQVGAALPIDVDLRMDSSWYVLLGELAKWRADQHLPDDLFVFGAVPPTAQTMIGGIAASLAVEDPYWRVTAGQLSRVEDEVNLIPHELGHALGRSHAPCGNPGGPDFAYPYEEAKIGVPGFDFRTPELRDPTATFDILSYCVPTFVSDYGYAAFYRSLTALADRSAPALGDPGIVVDRRWLP